jgi:predicted phage tail protein
MPRQPEAFNRWRVEGRNYAGLGADTVKCVTVVSSAAIVKMSCCALVAFAKFHSDRSICAMGKALIFDGCAAILSKQASGSTR